MTDPVFVYALVDPRDPEMIRYVGMTADILRRHFEHTVKSRHVPNRPRGDWVDAMQRDGITPGIRVLSEHTDRAAARIAEWHTVRRLRKRGQCDFNARIPAPPGVVVDWWEHLA